MLRYRVQAIIVAIAVLAGGAAVATAQDATTQTPGSHIAVLSCYPHVHAPGVTHPWIDPYGVHHNPSPFPSDEGFLGIDYRNDAKTSAKEIDFGLVVRDSLVATAKDVGTFSTGVKIQHEFVISREVFPIGTSEPVCAVLRVKYADGSEWVNPRPPPDQG